MTEDRFRKVFLLLLVVAISAAFVAMIRMFLLTILLAAIFAAVARPLYLELLRVLRGHRAIASAATLVILLLLVITPLTLLAGAVANEALRVADNVRPWIEARIQQPGLIGETLEKLPFYEYIEPLQTQIVERAAQLVGAAGTQLLTTTGRARKRSSPLRDGRGAPTKRRHGSGGSSAASSFPGFADRPPPLRHHGLPTT